MQEEIQEELISDLFQVPPLELLDAEENEDSADLWSHILTDETLDEEIGNVSPVRSEDMTLDAASMELIDSWSADEEFRQSLASASVNAFLPTELIVPTLISETEESAEWKAFIPAVPKLQTPDIFTIINPFDYEQQFKSPLSKPILREDGFLLVGTESSTYTSCLPAYQHQIMATNYRKPIHLTNVTIADEVRDLNWVNDSVVAAAIGKDVNLFRIGMHTTLASCQLLGTVYRSPSPNKEADDCGIAVGSSIMVHSDAVREIAASRSIGPYLLTGGFDQTVCVSDLRLSGGERANPLLIKYDAMDVVSSVRWSLTEGQLSWTTDGGDFQMADIRSRAGQIRTTLSKCWNVQFFGGLFSHEYIDLYKVVLGFEMGQLLVLDTRMPRLQSGLYHIFSSPLLSNGELQRSKCMPSKVALFGMGSFSFAEISSVLDVCKDNLFSLEPGNAFPFTQQDACYKTSGDFCYDNDRILAVSDNRGIVSVFEI